MCHNAYMAEAAGPRDGAGIDARFESAMRGLWVAFQPIVSTRRRCTYGYEAFLRTDGEPTLSAPGELARAAERLGHARALGRAVRARIAETAASNADALLFVHVHANDLDDFELYSSTSPLSKVARRVVLQITERHALDDVTGLLTKVKKLRALGFRIAIDELGEAHGLSSLSRLEPDVVKLAASLVRDVDRFSRKLCVVRSLVSLCCHELEMSLVCEGVETAAERDALADAGCDLMQGCLFGGPGRELTSAAG